MTIRLTSETIPTGKALMIKSSKVSPDLSAIIIPIGFPITVQELPIFVASTTEII